MRDRGLLRPGVPGLALLLILAGCGSSDPGAGAPPPPTPAAPAPLEPGDAIAVNFSLEPDQSGTYSVDENGVVGLPFLGNRTVRGVPPDDLKTGLLQEYGTRLRNQTIDVRLLRRIRVLGAVRQPNLYHVDATMTLADAVAEAGGVLEDGNLEEVQVLRDGVVVHTNLGTGVGVFQDLHSGDQIYVPQRSWFQRNGVILLSALISATAIISAQAFF